MAQLEAFKCPMCRTIYGALGYAFCPLCSMYCNYQPDLVVLTDNTTHKRLGVFRTEDLKNAPAGTLPEPLSA